MQMRSRPHSVQTHMQKSCTADIKAEIREWWGRRGKNHTHNIADQETTVKAKVLHRKEPLKHKT